MRKFVYAHPIVTFKSVLIVCISSILIISACRKADNAAELPTPSKEMSITERFFTIPTTTNSTVKSIAQSIYRQNEKGKFVEELVAKVGYPRWDKARIATKKAGSIHTESDSSGYNDILYIPFAIPTANTTAAVLAVGIKSNDTTYNLVYPQSYQQYGFDTSTTMWNARNIFQLFTDFDYAIFGHTIFKVNDGRILGFNADDTLLVTRTESSANTSNAGPSADSWVEVCQDYFILIVSTFADARVATESWYTFTICNTYWDDSFNEPPYGGGGNGSGGSGGGGTGGGGSGDGTVWPNDPECPELPRTGNITESGTIDPCNTGWVPDPTNSYDPDLDPASYTENPEILLFEGGYRGQMSTLELTIFDNLPRLKQLQYLFNAKSALDKAQLYFPTSVLNGNGDAFRHAYFSAMNAKVLGVQLAKQLGDAHETLPNSNALENQMDLFNNQVGRDKYVYLSQNGFGGSFFKETIIIALINQYIPNGELRQISPLGSNSEILPTSQLIPTN